MNKNKLVIDILGRLRTGDKSIENDVLDIKGEWYSNTNKPKNEWRDDFLKDVCAFANNYEGKTGHLIFGLKENPHHLNSIAINEDEASLQQIISSNINPEPEIVLERVALEGSYTYVLSITGEILNLPYFAKLSDNNHRIYLRRGSSINQCKKEELDKMLEAKHGKELSLKVEAHAIKSVRDIDYELKHVTKEELYKSLNKLNQYTENQTFFVYREVLQVVYNHMRSLPYKGSGKTRSLYFEILFNGLQLYSLVNSLNRKIPQIHISLLKKGIYVSREICFRSLKRSNSPKIFGGGINILGQILRFSHLNNLSEIKDLSLKVFRELEDLGTRDNLKEELEWIYFQKNDALILDTSKIPRLNSDLLKKFGLG